jgi:hypothetical protein
MTTTTARPRTFGAVAVAAVLALSACSGGDANPGSEQEVSEDEQTQVLAFVDCMRDNDFDMPDPGPGQEGLMSALQEARGGHGQGVVDESFEKAFAACEDQLPEFATHDEGERDEEAMLALAECLREQGLDVPDDLYSGNAMHDIDEDELRAAMEACRDEVDAVRGGHG